MSVTRSGRWMAVSTAVMMVVFAIAWSSGDRAQTASAAAAQSAPSGAEGQQRPQRPPVNPLNPAKVDPERAQRLYVSNDPEDNSLGHNFQRDVEEKARIDQRFAEASKV